MNSYRIKVLIVEDSSVAQMLLARILGADPQVEVIGTAANGRHALHFLERATPDVILMDIHMPEMDGFEATRRIMETQPVPIVICSASMPDHPREMVKAFRFLEAGAVACVEKPVGPTNEDFQVKAAHLVQTIKLMSEVKVVRRFPRSRPVANDQIVWMPSAPAKPAHGEIEAVGIGTSTGGPPVLQTILSGLTADFPVPILIVQHIASGFLSGMVEWLKQHTPLPVQIAAHDIPARPGHIYLAPDDFHLTVRTGGQIMLTKEPHHHGLRPSVARLFQSLAQTYGASAIGVLLTGMGRDGAAELKEMRDRGATTIVQDQETSVVHGMPGAALALDAASFVLPADRIASALTTLISRVPHVGERSHA